MGSCFAEHIGERLANDKFRVDNNPFGTLYNPASIAEGLRRLLRPEPLSASDLFAHEGSYHSFAYHSRFLRPDCGGGAAADERAAAPLGGTVAECLPIDFDLGHCLCLSVEA